MRKLIVELKPNSDLMNEAIKKWFDKFESINVLELLRLDFEHGIKLGVAEYNLKEGYTIEDVKAPNIETVNVFKKDGNQYTCLVKVQVPHEFKALMKKFDLDLIWDTPMSISKDKVVYSCIGEHENLKTFLELLKTIGEVQKVAYHRATYQEHNVLSCLTDRQKEIIIAAKKSGYYKYPRKIDANKLSQKLGISKATTVEHLRKAELRLISNILAGY